MIRFVLISLVAMVAGCAGLRSDEPPVQVYFLRAAATPAVAASEQALALGEARAAEAAGSALSTSAPPTLQVSRPHADPGLSTELITLVRSDRRMDRYAGSSWPATVPDVVETLAIDTLRATGDWAAVNDAPSPFVSDYALHINIRRFEADYTEGRDVPKVYVTLDCTVARRAGRQLLASFVAEGVAEASANRMSEVVAAFERAANIALARMAERSAAAVRTSTARSTP